VISWDLPDSRGSAITQYIITIKESDDVTFTTELVVCDGSNTNIIANRACTVPITSLRSSPFNLAWGSSVFAKLIAINVYGTSVESSTGNGAIILTIPDAPITLAGDPDLTTGTSVGLEWAEGISNGGTPVLDYRIWSD
jgi:hypothetical protein